MNTDRTLATYYADRAAEYERIYQKAERQEDLSTLRHFVERTFAGAHVLEIACGTGYWTEIVARSAASVLATDINEEVLAIARSKALDPQKVMFQKEDAYGLGPRPHRFTAGFAAFWWSHVPKTRLPEFLRGFHSVLAPGARLLFIDNTYVEGSSTPICRTDGDGNTYQLRRLDNGRTYEVLKNFPSEKELRITVADFADQVQVQLLRYYWILTYRIRQAEVSTN